MGVILLRRGDHRYDFVVSETSCWGLLARSCFTWSTIAMVVLLTIAKMVPRREGICEDCLKYARLLEEGACRGVLCLGKCHGMIDTPTVGTI